MKSVLYGTIASVLTFFSISFLTVLSQINSPVNGLTHYYELKIGFPLVYYHEFMLDCPTPNWEWKIDHLFWDCLLTWILITGIYILWQRTRNKRCNKVLKI